MLGYRLRTRTTGRRITLTFLCSSLLCLTILSGTGHSAYLRPGVTDRVSLASDGTQAKSTTGLNSSTWASEISANGRVVVFVSAADNLVGPRQDKNLSADIFAHDLVTKKTQRVSVSSAGVEGLVDDGLPLLCDTSNYGAERPTVSANGRFVAFDSCYPNLVAGDLNATWDVFVRDLKKGVTERVSLSSKGIEGNASSVQATISGNGRFVTFLSDADNFVEGDENGLRDAFVHDRRTGRTVRVTVAPDGSEATDGGTSGATGNCPSINHTGRYVTFTSPSGELVADDTNAALDVFVRDLKKDTTKRVSVASDGRETSGSTTCWTAAFSGRRISASGRYVTFWSTASDLVPNDGNKAFHDIFIHDRVSGRTERVSVDSYGRTGNHASRLSGLSPDGRYVAFESFNRFTPQDTNPDAPYVVDTVQGGDQDVFIYDRATGMTEMMSVDSKGREARNCTLLDTSNPLNAIVRLVGSNPNAPISTSASVSAGGRRVAFNSCADNLVPKDTNGSMDAFVRDRGVALGTNDRKGDAGPPPDPSPLPLPVPPTSDLWSEYPSSRSVVVDGTRPRVLAKVHERRGDSTGLGHDQDLYDLLGGAIAYRPTLSDLFVTIEVQRLSSIGRVGGRGLDDPGVIYGVTFRSQGTRYEIRATDWMGDGALSQQGRVGLFTCRATCVEQTELPAGYGTTGERVVVGLPLSEIGLKPGDRLSAIALFSGTGTYATGVTHVADTSGG